MYVKSILVSFTKLKSFTVLIQFTLVATIWNHTFLCSDLKWLTGLKILVSHYKYGYLEGKPSIEAIKGHGT